MNSITIEFPFSSILFIQHFHLFDINYQLCVCVIMPQLNDNLINILHTQYTFSTFCSKFILIILIADHKIAIKLIRFMSFSCILVSSGIQHFFGRIFCFSSIRVPIPVEHFFAFHHFHGNFINNFLIANSFLDLTLHKIIIFGRYRFIQKV